MLTVLYLSVQFDHTNFGQFSDLRFNLEIFVFSAVIFASSISSEIPIERLNFEKELRLLNNDTKVYFDTDPHMIPGPQMIPKLYHK